MCSPLIISEIEVQFVLNIKFYNVKESIILYIAVYFYNCGRINEINLQHVVGTVNASALLSEEENGFGLIVVDVGMAADFIEWSVVDVDFLHMRWVDRDMAGNHIVAFGGHSIDLHKLFLADEATEQVAVADYAVCEYGSDAVQQLQVEGVGAVEFDGEFPFRGWRFRRIEVFVS